ncbi:MAG: hypothetical protein ACP5OG_04500 [Candidatus Nanoarchaeia archaeon]
MEYPLANIPLQKVKVDIPEIQKIAKINIITQALDEWVSQRFDALFSRVPEKYIYVSASADIDNPPKVPEIKYFTQKRTSKGIRGLLKKIFLKENPPGLLDYVNECAKKNKVCYYDYRYQKQTTPIMF